MGLDAFVPCRCWEEGRCSAPPVPAEWIEREEGRLTLKAEFDSDKNWQSLQAWTRNACPHQRMQACSEHLSNWAGVRSFQQCLGAYPRLRDCFPAGNGGEVSASQAALLLEELEARLQDPDWGERWELVDQDGELIFEWIACYDGVFGYLGELRLGLDSHGLFIRDGQVEVFRALRGRHHQGEFVGESGQRWSGPLHLDGPYGPVREFQVRRRSLGPDDYRAMCGSLLRLLKTSVELQMPLYWT